MRIGIVGPVHPHTGGIAQHTTRLALELEHRGHDVVVESWRNQYPLWLHRGTHKVSGPPEIGEPRQVRQSLAWYSPASWWQGGARLRDRDLVVFSVPTPQHFFPYRLITGALGNQPVRVGIVHNVVPHEHRLLDRALMKSLTKLMDHVIVHGDQQRDLLTSLKSGTPIATRSLPSPWLTPPPTSSRRTRSLGDPIRLLFFGSVRAYKGVDLLLTALSDVEGIELIVAGDFWGNVEDYRAQVVSLALTDRVDLRPGYVPAESLSTLFAEADALVLPYRSGSGSIVRELGFRFGLPVVSTRVGAIADGIENGVNGLLIENPTPEDIAHTLRTLTKPGLLETLTRGATSYASDQKALWNSYCETVERAGRHSLA